MPGFFTTRVFGDLLRALLWDAKGSNLELAPHGSHGHECLVGRGRRAVCGVGRAETVAPVASSFSRGLRPPTEQAGYMQPKSAILIGESLFALIFAVMVPLHLVLNLETSPVRARVVSHQRLGLPFSCQPGAFAVFIRPYE